MNDKTETFVDLNAIKSADAVVVADPAKLWAWITEYAVLLGDPACEEAEANIRAMLGLEESHEHPENRQNAHCDRPFR